MRSLAAMDAREAPNDPINAPSTPPRAARAPREDLRSPRGGRGRGGRGRGMQGNEGYQRGGRGRGRGQNRRLSETQPVDPTKPALPAREIRRSSTAGSSGGAAQVNGEAPEAAIAEDDEQEVCFICASPVVHYSIAPCNHRTCHICALRLRALYKRNTCAHCRASSEYLLFTDDTGKRYEDFKDADFYKTDSSLGIRYEKVDIFDDTVQLLRYNCPDKLCEMACYGWPDLHRHVRNVHHKVMW